MSTKTRIVKNGIAAIFFKGIRVVEQLLLIPFFIQHWGAAYYGEWITLTIVPSMLALADFGFGSAAANTFLLKYAGHDKQGAADVAKTGSIILTFLIMVALLLAGAIVWTLNYFGTFERLLIDNHSAIIAVLLLLTARIVNFYQALYEAYYRAARRADISIHFKTIIAVANIIVSLVVLWSGGRVVEYASAILLISVLFNPIYIYIGRRVLGLYKVHIGKVDKRLIRPLVNKGFGYFLSPIWQAIYYQGITLVVRITVGPIAVTVFNTVRTLIRSSSQAFAMTITASYPDFQFEIGAGNYDKAKKIFSSVLIWNILMAILFIIGLILFGEILYHWWTKNALDVPVPVWYIFIAGIFFYACWFTCSFVFEALNKPYTNTLAGFVCSIFVVSLSWCLCSYVGLIGAAIGCLIFDILMCLYIMPKVATQLGLTFSQVSERLLSLLHLNNKYTRKHL